LTGARVGLTGAGVGSTGADVGPFVGGRVGATGAAVGSLQENHRVVSTIEQRNALNPKLYKNAYLVKPFPPFCPVQSQTPPFAGSTTSSAEIIPLSE